MVEPGDLSDIAFGLFAKHTELVRLRGDRIALKPELGSVESQAVPLK